jgi:tRNA-specific 2-thiouridylase
MSDTFLPGNGFDTYETQDKVLVGMSGGVDSSVTACILRQQGFGVTGAVIRFSPAHEEAVQAAKRIAEQIGIECIVLNAEDLFEKEVIAPFCTAYAEGRTPNSCVLCNPAVKFAALATAADRLGIQYIATGHYARVEVDEDGFSRIHQPLCIECDQSYMLSRLPQDILARLLLPLGEFEKDDVYEMAHEFKLECDDAPNNTEICFVPDGDYAAFIEARGSHGKEGQFLSPDDVNLDSAESFSTVLVDKPITPDGVALPAGDYQVRVRSAEQPALASFDGAHTLRFVEPVHAAAPGQTAVFYLGDTVVGSSFITDAMV